MSSKTIRISKDEAGIVKQQAKRNGVTQIQWIDAAVNFINKTGYDIFKKNVIKTQSIEDRIISFMKKREQKYFDPMEKYFNESKDVLSKVLLGLESFGIVELLEKEAKEEEKERNKEAKLKPVLDGNIKSVLSEENVAEKVEENQDNLDQKKSADYDKIIYDLKLEKAKFESENFVFKNEIIFLLKNIKPGGALSNSKYVINVTTKDIDRVKKLVS